MQSVCKLYGKLFALRCHDDGRLTRSRAVIGRQPLGQSQAVLAGSRDSPGQSWASCVTRIELTGIRNRLQLFVRKKLESVANNYLSWNIERGTLIKIDYLSIFILFMIISSKFIVVFIFLSLS